MPTFAELAANSQPLSEQFLNAAKKGDLTTIDILFAGKPALLITEDDEGRNAWWFAYAGHHLETADKLLDFGLRAPDSYYVLEQLREQFYQVNYCTDDADLLLRISTVCLVQAGWRVSDTIALLKRCKDDKLTRLGNDLNDFFHSRYDKSAAATNQLNWYLIRIITSISTAAKSKLSLNLPACREIINLKDVRGLTLLDYATRESNPSNVALFIELGADITNFMSHVNSWSQERSEQARFLLLTTVYANLSTRFTKNNYSLVHLAGVHDIPALISLCCAARIPLNSVSQTDSITPLSLTLGYTARNLVLTQLLVNGARPSIHQQRMLSNSGIDLYNCLVERTNLIDNDNRRNRANQATQAADISTLTTALIDTRKQNQDLLQKISSLEENLKLSNSKLKLLQLTSELKQVELENQILTLEEQLEEQIEKRLKEQPKQAKQTTECSPTTTNTQTPAPAPSFFK